MEHWAPIEGIGGYEVSDLGFVRNEHTGRVLTMTNNGQNVIQVVMRDGGRHICRAVHKLVANAFLFPGPPGCVPIHLDHDFENNRADNLEWKDLGYARKRSNQWRRTEPRDPRPVLHINSGIAYDNALECAKAIDGLEELVIITAQRKYGATYMGSEFAFLSF